jgi:gamma-glutamyltranspeptidase / glutathione hydrolase
MCRLDDEGWQLEERELSASSEPQIGGVVTCVEAYAAEAGAAMLRMGGNAADAAVATAFAQGVVNPVHCGIAGAFHGIFADKGKGVTCISGGGRAPQAASENMWRPAGRWSAVWDVEGKRNRLGYQASVVPGFVRAAHEAFTRFGSQRVTWAQALAPAIELADEGFEVYPYLYRLWMPRGERSHGFLEYDGVTMLTQTPEARRIYLKNGERVYEIGEHLFQHDYARTLERVAAEGPGEFYTGETGQRIAADFAANGGLLSAADLRRYEADISEPIATTFRGHDVMTEPTPSVGPVGLELLNIIEGWNLRELGWNTAPYLDRLARAMNLAFRDRMDWLADPDFVDVPMERLISKAYAAGLRGQIDDGTEPTRREPEVISQTTAEGTTSVATIDRMGNAAVIIHSIGSGSGVVTPGLGFIHNNHMIAFDPTPGHRNSIAPWKRPLTGGGPTILRRDGEVTLAIGSPAGARKVTAQTQAIMNMSDFNMGVQDAVSVDRIHAEDEPMTIIVEPFFPQATLTELAHLGHRIRYEWYTARLTAVSRNPMSGHLEGGSDSRGAGGLAVV